MSLSILFYKGSTIVGRIIRKMTDSNYSHVALKIDDIHIIETDYKSPLLITHNYWKSEDYDVYKVDITTEQRDMILKYIHKHLGAKYDFAHIFSRALNVLFGTRVIKSSGKFNCDEIIVDAFTYAGIDLMEGKILSPENMSKSRKLQKD